MRILLLNPNTIQRANWGHQLFRNEIGQQHDVTYYGKGCKYFQCTDLKAKIGKKNLLHVCKIIDTYCDEKPDILLTYDSYSNVNNPGMRGLTDIIKININVDYETNIDIQNEFFKKHRYDLIFAVVQSTLDIMKKHNVCKRLYFLPFSVDTNIYKKLDLPKEYDVCAVFTVKDGLYPNRGEIHNILNEMNIKTTTTKVAQKKLIDIINKSKIIVTSNNRFGHLSMRYTETLACGGFLLADRPKDLDRLGFVDGKHLVIYDGLDDFKDKVTYYLKPENEKEREEIAKNGMEYVRANHSCEIRVKEMTNIIKKEFY